MLHSLPPFVEWGIRPSHSDSAPGIVASLVGDAVIHWWPCKKHPPPNYLTHCLITTMTWRPTLFLGKRCSTNWPLKRKKSSRKHSTHASQQQ